MAGTKTRIKQTAATCRAHVLETGNAVAREFISDIESAYCEGKRGRVDRNEAWSVFVDQRQITSEMLERVMASFKAYDAGMPNFLPGS